MSGRVETRVSLPARVVEWSERTDAPQADGISRQIIKEYGDRIGRLTDNVAEVRLMGSVGRHRATKTSDMDVWLIMKDDSDRKMWGAIVASERSVRSEIATQLGLAELNRHPPGIFTVSEALAYEQAFLVRVHVPRKRREYLCWGKEPVSLGVDYSESAIQADLAASLLEFVENWEKSVCDGKGNGHKWIKRLIREIEFFTGNGYMLSDDETDSWLANKYLGRPDTVVNMAKDVIQKITAELGQDAIERRKLLHGLAWTMEKVRWVMLDPEVNKLIQEWRFGQLNYQPPVFGPRKIGGLIVKVAELGYVLPESARELGMMLMRTTRDGQTDTRWPLEFDKTLAQWVIEEINAIHRDYPQRQDSGNVIVPTELPDGRRMVTKIFGPQLGYRGRSTAMALKILGMGATLIRERGHTLIEQPDIEGRPVTIEDLRITGVTEYAQLMREIHLQGMPHFGRLGAERNFATLSEYFLFRLRLVRGKIPEIADRLTRLIELHRVGLDQVKPVLCHMDTGLRNLIFGSDGKLRLIDFEHASGCIADWDIGRACLCLPPDLARELRRECNRHPIQRNNRQVVMITELVMRATFAANLDDTTMRLGILSEVEKSLRQQQLDGQATTRTIPALPAPRRNKI